MDWQVYVYSFLAGMLVANGVPHFVKGVTGQSFMTPFSKQSSATVNVVWGWLNFLVGLLLIYSGHVHQHLLRAFACAAVGSLLVALLLSRLHDHK